MIDSKEFADVAVSPETEKAESSAEHINFGLPIPKASRVLLFSDKEWEKFTEEWLLTRGYLRVARSGAAGDMGIDVAGFVSPDEFAGVWDNYQCKHYDHPLAPSDVWKEISKLVYYTWAGEYAVPRAYYFVAPRDIGTKLQRLLSDTDNLKREAKENWVEHIAPTLRAELEGSLLAYFDKFDFSIFSSVSVANMINEHATSPSHAVRFGGGLPPRPPVDLPPENPVELESRYIQQLFNAYSEHLGLQVERAEDLIPPENGKFQRDFLRQRERFYHAESLRNFARDTVPEGTFENLENEIHSAVVDVCERDAYADGYERMRETLIHASGIATPSNPLFSVVKAQDRLGICHRFANTDRLIWTKEGAKDES